MSEFGSETERNREIFFEQAANRAVQKVWERLDLAEVINNAEEQNEEDLEALAHLTIEYIKSDLSDLVEEGFIEAGETFGLSIQTFGDKLGRKFFAYIKDKIKGCIESGEFTGDFADILEARLEGLF